MPDKKVKGLQVAVWDVGNNPLKTEVVQELEQAVENILQQHTTLAHTVVIADWHKPARKVKRDANRS